MAFPPAGLRWTAPSSDTFFFLGPVSKSFWHAGAIGRVPVQRPVKTSTALLRNANKPRGRMNPPQRAELLRSPPATRRTACKLYPTATVPAGAGQTAVVQHPNDQPTSPGEEAKSNLFFSSSTPPKLRRLALELAPVGPSPSPAIRAVTRPSHHSQSEMHATAGSI